MKTQIRNCSCGKPREKSWHLACPSCWALVPKALQEEVYRLYKKSPGSNAHKEAVLKCYRVIHEARKPEKGGLFTGQLDQIAEADE